MFEYRGKNLPRAPEQLIRILGLPFKPTLRIEEALTHRSASHERGKKTPIPNYERLEFLGDRVIGLIVSEYLLNTWPSASEGDIGQVFSGIVSTQTLAAIARRMDLGAYMILGKGSHSSGDRENSSLLADTFESLAAALYLEYGLETARQVLIPWFTQPLVEMVAQLDLQREAREAPAIIVQTPSPVSPAAAPVSSRRNGTLNYKLLLQKWSQSHHGELPAYQVLEEIGPAHQRRFKMGVFVHGLLMGESEGSTKRGASVLAAKKAWEKIQSDSTADFSGEVYEISVETSEFTEVLEVRSTDPGEIEGNADVESDLVLHVEYEENYVNELKQTDLPLEFEEIREEFIRKELEDEEEQKKGE
ncbi:MAG: ribonuclease III family protein [Leptospirales bacterium]